VRPQRNGAAGVLEVLPDASGGPNPASEKNEKAHTMSTPMSTPASMPMPTTTTGPLADRVAVITGASSGIGEATAEHLASLGARVVVLARRADRLHRLAARITEHGGTALAIVTDVTDPAAVQAAADRTAAAFGEADLVVNNAGIMLPAPIQESATDQWRHQIDLNINGLMNTVAAFTPHLIRTAAAHGTADLINTSSIAAQNIYPDFAVYAATKAYVTHLSRHLRTELGPKNVRVSAIEPGIVATELQSHVTDPGALSWLDATKQTIEWLTPQDIATTIGFLAGLPPRVNLQQVTIMPTGQTS
jgi:NADP-dependent 3-hydroxy acid dehydrogenase YdfG